MACVDALPFAVAEKYLDSRGTGIPMVILPDISSVLASISEILMKLKRLSGFSSFYNFSSINCYQKNYQIFLKIFF